MTWLFVYSQELGMTAALCLVGAGELVAAYLACWWRYPYCGAV